MGGEILKRSWRIEQIEIVGVIYFTMTVKNLSKSCKKKLIFLMERSSDSAFISTSFYFKWIDRYKFKMIRKILEYFYKMKI